MKNIKVKKFVATVVALSLAASLAGCGKAAEVSKQASEELAEASEDLSGNLRKEATQDWVTRVKPLNKEPGTVLGSTDLGSHTITASIPQLDKSMRKLLKQEEMSCVEIHFARNEGGPEPTFEMEPETSAVYYFYKTDDAGNDLEIAWSKTAEDQLLCTGVQILRPAYIMKIMVYCQLDDPGAVESMYLADVAGVNEGRVLTGVENTTFSECSLRLSPTFAGQLTEM